MTQKKDYAERIGVALTRPMQIQPTDSAWKKALRIGYGIVSPVVVGPAVLGGYAADKIRHLGYLPEISRGMGQFERTPVGSVGPIWRINAPRHSPAPKPIPSVPKSSSPSAPSPRLPDPKAPKLHRPGLGRVVHKPSFGFRTPKLSLTSSLGNAGQVGTTLGTQGHKMKIRTLHVPAGKPGSHRIGPRHGGSHGKAR